MKTSQRVVTQVDLLNGDIFSSLVKFAIPLLFSNLFQQLYSTVDTIIVGHTLGENALASMGAAQPIFDILVGFALGMGAGLSIVVARNFGARNEEMLKKAVATAIVIGMGMTLFLTVAGTVFMIPFLEIINTPAEILYEAYSYISVIIWFMGITFAYNLCSGMLRAIGDSIMPLLFLIFSSLLNIGLDYLLILVVNMGVRGAAVATVISQAISVILCLVYISRFAKSIVPAKEHFEFDADLYKEMFAQGLSMGMMQCVISAATAILQMGINKLGYLVIAGHTAARKLFGFCMMPYGAMIMAVNSFVSQNYGAGQIDRIRKAMKYAYIYNTVVSLCITIIMLAFAPLLIQGISGSNEPIIIENGTYYLRVLGPGLCIVGIVNETRTALQAIGSKILPLCSSMIELVGKIVFVIYLVPKYQYDAVVYCEPVIWCFMAVFLVIAFWKNPIIRNND